MFWQLCSQSTKSPRARWRESRRGWIGSNARISTILSVLRYICSLKRSRRGVSPRSATGNSARHEPCSVKRQPQRKVPSAQALAEWHLAVAYLLSQMLPDALRALNRAHFSSLVSLDQLAALAEKPSQQLIGEETHREVGLRTGFHARAEHRVPRAQTGRPRCGQGKDCLAARGQPRIDLHNAIQRTRELLGHPAEQCPPATLVSDGLSRYVILGAGSNPIRVGSVAIAICDAVVWNDWELLDVELSATCPRDARVGQLAVDFFALRSPQPSHPPVEALAIQADTARFDSEVFPTPRVCRRFQATSHVRERDLERSRTLGVDDPRPARRRAG